jgi:Zn-dependent peptidase ImmA (M78 family)
MKSVTELSGSEIVVEFLKIIWMPAAEALNVQNDLNVHSLNETSAAAERAGYEICYADLPAKVSGFAMSIAGKPHIVVNRAKSTEHQQYTLFHELGHQVLHANPSRNPSALLIEGMEEFQAHIFAFVWIMRVASVKERENVLRQNPESSAFMSLAVVMTGGILAVALLVYLLSRLFPTKPSSALRKT